MIAIVVGSDGAAQFQLRDSSYEKECNFFQHINLTSQTS